MFARHFLFLITGSQLEFPSESSPMYIFIIQPYVILNKVNERVSPFVMLFVPTDLPSLSPDWDRLNDIGQGSSFR